MFKRLARTIRGPSQDPRMDHISRPLPRDLTDEDLVAALDIALREDPDPSYLVETLPSALRQVTGRDYQVLDRSVRDVTGRYRKSLVMVRDGDVGRWRGYDVMAYPLIAPTEKARETLAAIAATDAGEADDEAQRAASIGARWRAALGSGAAPPREDSEGGH
jgi:hypothetical protein